jgi:ATP-dependent Clp protease ATP-binding subunit ClpC
VGYDDAGQLTEALRRRPYSIVVFDEVEKAHPEAHNLLLQIMEEGRLSDARGRKVDFRNAMIVMTSNVGADMIKRQTSLGFSIHRDETMEDHLAYDEMQKKLTDQLKRVFRPEFLNRVDATIVFRALNRDEIHEIVDLEIAKVAHRLEEHQLRLETTPAAREFIAEKGYHPDYGARPLKRVIQQRIEDVLSDGLLSGKFQVGQTIEIDVRDGEIVMEGREGADSNGAVAQAEQPPEALPDTVPV